MDIMTLRVREGTYTVVTAGGMTHIVCGTLRVYGDLVIIGSNVFCRPDSVTD